MIKTYKIIGGLFVTAALVSAGSVFSGAQAKIKQQKRDLLEARNSISSMNFHNNAKNFIENNPEIKQISFGLNKACKTALEAFEIKAQYEKFQLQTLKTLKNPTTESLKAIKVVKG